MSVHIMSMVFRAKLPDTQVGKNNVAQATMKSVLLALADHANDEGKSIYPAISRLELMTGLKDRTIQRAEEALEMLGILRHDGWSEYGTKNYSIIPSSLSQYIGGDSSDKKAYQNHPPGDSDYKKRVPESPKPSYKPSINQKDTDAVFTKISELKYRFNANTPTLVSIWRESHTDEIILAALDKCKGKSINYVDAVLADWKINGRPQAKQAQPKADKMKQTTDMLSAWLASKEQAAVYGD